jgi:capsular exopolysaccharide synthesis family protein
MSDLLPANLPPDGPLERGYGGYYGYGPPTEPAGAGSSTRASRFLGFLRRFWWIPALTLTLSAAGAAFYVIRFSEPVFVSSARMWETEKLNLPGGAAFTADVQSYLGTQLELLRSGKLVQLALATLRASGTNAVPLDKTGNPLKVDLKVVQAPKSTVFAVQAFSSDPEYARRFLDALMDSYLSYKKEIRKNLSGDTYVSIKDQLLRLERELKDNQAEFSAFQRSNNLAVLQQDATTAGGYLASLKTELSRLTLESQLLSATLREQQAASAGSANSNFDLVEAMRRAASSGPGDSVASQRPSAFQEVEVLKVQREKLSKYLRPKHPKIVKLDNDIERSQKIIELYRNQSRDQLAASRQALDMRLNSVTNTIKEWESKVTEFSAKIADAERLKANLARQQSMYDRLVTLLDNVEITSKIDQETLNILEPASPAIRSYQQEKSLLATSLFGGLAFGLAIVFLIERKDDRLTSITEVTEKLGDDIVGQVPELPTGRRNSTIPLLEENDERHMFAESYRSLRSALLFLPNEGEHPRILLITSAIPNEGKSTIAANLARTLAEGGARVLLIDADLRKGRLHEMLDMQREPGLSELIRQPDDLARIIQNNSIPNLTFIARGSNLAPPGKLFLSRSLPDLLSLWRQQYDYILIDTCPIFAADDAATLAPKVDGTLFVVRSRFSSARCVREALELLARRQARVLGLIYNRAETSSRSHYYKYADYYQRNGKARKET